MNLKIIIIEDETVVAMHIKIIVLRLGHTVVAVVKNSDDALEAAKCMCVDLVVSDINIAGDKNGIECCAILQELYNVYTILITAYRDLETLKKASAINFVGYLVKPFREDELEAMLTLTQIKYEQNLQTTVIINGSYTYSYKSNNLYLNNNLLKLTKKEHRFLLELIKSRGTLVTYDILEAYVWDNEPISEGTVRQMVHRFKKKVPNFPFVLVKSMGYKLQV